MNLMNSLGTDTTIFGISIRWRNDYYESALYSGFYGGDIGDDEQFGLWISQVTCKEPVLSVYC